MYPELHKLGERFDFKIIYCGEVPPKSVFVSECSFAKISPYEEEVWLVRGCRIEQRSAMRTCQ